MKNFLVLFTLLLVSIFSFGKQIDEATAKKVGYNFLTHKTKAFSQKNLCELRLVYTLSSKANSISSAPLMATNFFYVFNIYKIKGFVIVSADDAIIPVLGYSDEGNFDPNNIPKNTAKWFEGYKEEIRNVVENKIEATQGIKEEWKNLISGSNLNSVTNSASSVSPLVQTKWDQSPYYNDLCPYDNGAGERVVTGCVATAMAQVMKFWNYPKTGKGFHSYNHKTYGTLSANFGSTTYDWNSMTNSVSGTNSAVATLMYHCGVSVDMDYGLGANGGSSAATLDVVNALKTYFGYPSSVQGLYRKDYSESQWINILKGELDSGRPMQYAGTGSKGGHSFVCDGYDNNDYFHFNWGWSGSSDGYFSINNLSPGSLGTGGGGGGFTTNHRVIIGIKAPKSSQIQTFDMQLYDYVTPYQSSMTYGDSIAVKTNIINNGTNTFNGDFCAAVFDDSSNFVDFIEVIKGVSLQGGYKYTNGITFSKSYLYSMLPGTYTVSIFYRPTGGNWSLVSNSGSYKNFETITVTYSSDIEMNSKIILTPGKRFTKGKPASANLNIINNGASTFTGKYRVALFDLDGNFVEEIGSVDETSGLPSGYTYKSPYLTFSSTTITANPGTYLLALQHKETSATYWDLGGSTSFQNPIKITVQLPPPLADQYEVNDNQSQSYSLSANFSNDKANINTNGSNCHVGNDYDYFKVSLPSGYNYIINPRIHDAGSSGNGNTYTLDGLFSYSVDGTTYSDAFDNTIPNPFVLNGGGTVYFLVAPYFNGETGTYLLDVNITRTTGNGIEENSFAGSIKISPNPAKDFVNIDMNEFTGNASRIQIINVLGQEVFSTSVNQDLRKVKLPLVDIKDGVYFIQFQTNKGVLTKKIIIAN
ncbi:MAG: thiol protease/hemagglutinin PrtT [Bacteroidetes bacterium]|nr:thiol protease/hemagglutinin PrtT [Bacteroidota bacterium]